ERTRASSVAPALDDHGEEDKQDENSEHGDASKTGSIEDYVKWAVIKPEKVRHRLPEYDVAEVALFPGSAAAAGVMYDRGVGNVVDLPSCLCNGNAQIHIFRIHKVIGTKASNALDDLAPN